MGWCPANCANIRMLGNSWFSKWLSRTEIILLFRNADFWQCSICWLSYFSILAEEASLERDVVKQDHQKIQCQKQQQMRSKAYPVFPLSPDQGVEAELKSPGRPQSARNSPVIGSGAARHTIPEENLYNLFQLAEVSLAASGGSEFRNVLERWRHQQGLASRVLKSSAVKILDMTADPVLDKPLDLSRDPAAPSTEVLMLTPSPSPTPSEARLTSINIGLPKNLPQSSVGSEDDEEEDEELDATDSCWSPDDAASCKFVSLVKGPSSSPDVHECSDCGKRYSTSSNLARHRQTHRSPADQKVFHRIQ